MNVRPRRLRRTPVVRSLVREHDVRVDALVMPMFVVARDSDAGPISSMPGISRFTLEQAVPRRANSTRSACTAYCSSEFPTARMPSRRATTIRSGIVQRAIAAIKAAVPQMYVIADLCNCEYTDHGHCGILDERGDVDNDKTVELLVRTAITYAEAGVDVVAPSDMMDGRVEALAQRARCARLHRRRDHGLQRKICLRVLRAVSRSGRLDAAIRRPPQLSDGSTQRSRSACARSRSISKRAPTSS